MKVYDNDREFFGKMAYEIYVKSMETTTDEKYPEWKACGHDTQLAFRELGMAIADVARSDLLAVPPF